MLFVRSPILGTGSGLGTKVLESSNLLSPSEASVRTAELPAGLVLSARHTTSGLLMQGPRQDTGEREADGHTRPFPQGLYLRKRQPKSRPGHVSGSVKHSLLATR